MCQISLFPPNAREEKSLKPCWNCKISFYWHLLSHGTGLGESENCVMIKAYKMLLLQRQNCVALLDFACKTAMPKTKVKWSSTQVRLTHVGVVEYSKRVIEESFSSIKMTMLHLSVLIDGSYYLISSAYFRGGRGGKYWGRAGGLCQIYRRLYDLMICIHELTAFFSHVLICADINLRLSIWWWYLYKLHVFM